MLKHALSTSGVGNGGGVRHHVIQESRGFTPSDVRMTELPPNGSVRAYRSPPSGLNHSYPGPSLNMSIGSHQRSFNNPYSNVSTLSNSKHSIGGTSMSISPHVVANHIPNGGIHIPRTSAPPPTHYVDISHKLNNTGYTNHGLNISTLSTSKHSLGGNSSSVSPLGVASVHGPRMSNGGMNISRQLPPPPAMSPVSVTRIVERTKEPGVREMLTSLGLLCLVSLLLALLSLIFMLKISPVTAADVKDLIRSDQVTVISPEEYVLVYEVTLALCALSLSLNLCCLLVCAVQFLFAVKLVRDSPDGERTNKYLKKSAFTRVCAVGGFFVSIPVFLTGIILYTFIQFHSTPAVVTSILIGLGIMFCGCAMVHNVFVWQKEKTNAVRALAQQHRLAASFQQEQHSLAEQSRAMIHPSIIHTGSISPGPLPNATLDLSNETPTPPEICTLV